MGYVGAGVRQRQWQRVLLPEVGTEHNLEVHIKWKDEEEGG
jgi:hypothetical protein